MIDENEWKLNLSNFVVNNEILLKCFNIHRDCNSLDEITCLKNKMWSLFLMSDGSMTKNLKILYPQLKMKLISSEMIQNVLLDVEYKNLSSSILILRSFKDYIEFEISSRNLIERKIIFYTIEENNSLTSNEENDISSFDLKMIGISYWDEDFYNDLYSNKEEEKKPIGLIMIEKQIEFFKTIKNYVYNHNNNSNNKFIFRFSTFKVKNKVAFVLAEIFEVKTFFELFGKFE